MGLSKASAVAGLSSRRPSASRHFTTVRNMRKGLLPCLVAAAVLLAGVPAATRAQGTGTADKVPAVIPAPRPEPVVPPSPAKSIAQQLNDAFVAVFERVAPTVVIIDVTKKPSSEGEGGTDYFPDFFFHSPPDGSGGTPAAPGGRRNSKPRSEGSGFIIQSGGYILTNNHVVAGAEKITVKLKDRRQFTGRLVGVDDKTDIAVVKIDATDLPVAELADSEAVRVGEIACAIGVPYNLDYSFTTGVVSAKGRNNLDLGPTDNYEDFIQTDASINPGNSGGPLVNLDGKVMGMNTLINGLNRGLGFAIPSNMLREVGDQIIAKGRVTRPYIGVRILSLNSDRATDDYGGYFNWAKRGVIVTSILADAPAVRSDLHVSDVITEVDGTPVDSDRELQNQIRLKKIGTSVQLSVLRRGRPVKLNVVTAELPTDGPRTVSNGGDPTTKGDADLPKPEGGALYGMQVARAGVGGGVVVVTIDPDGPAARALIKPRDVIVQVDDEPVKDVAAFRDAMKKADPAKGIACYVERPEGKTFALIKTN